MKRLQLLELHEQKWMPEEITNAVTDFLHTIFARYHIYLPASELLSSVMEKTNCYHIIDLCSGGTGPISQIQSELEQKFKREVTIALTDIKPNVNAFMNVANSAKGRIHYNIKPVDARTYIQSDPGIRTFFSSFHHFNPDEAKIILYNITKNRAPVAIFEFTENSLLRLILDFLIPISVLLLMPRTRAFNLKRFFLTYILPILPLIIFFDGFVSNIRTYTPDALLSLAKTVNDQDYYWESDKIRSGFKYFNITYLIGYPK